MITMEHNDRIRKVLSVCLVDGSRYRFDSAESKWSFEKDDIATWRGNTIKCFPYSSIIEYSVDYVNDEVAE